MVTLLFLDISTVRRSFLYISAVIVLLMCLVRLILEVIQFKIQLTRYLLDWNNWIETILYFCSIIFVWVFHTNCLCPLSWQWQIGVVAVFLGWINLVVFISKFPLLGIYVLMFINIFKTFLKTLFLSILLLVSFGLAFYLTFTQNEILVYMHVVIFCSQTPLFILVNTVTAVSIFFPCKITVQDNHYDNWRA